MQKKLTYIVTLICLLAISSYVSAQDADSQQLVNKQKYQWAIEEVLQQLKELNRDINGIGKVRVTGTVYLIMFHIIK